MRLRPPTDADAQRAADIVIAVDIAETVFEHNELTGMGTTVSAIIRVGDDYYIATSSFVLTEADGTNVTVVVSGTTEFQGSAHTLADLKAHMHVTVKGSKQTDGTIAATSLLVGA